MKKLSFVLVGFCLFGVVAFSGVAMASYSDVPKGSVYYDAVQFLSDEGVVSGFSNGTFGTDLSLTRAQLLKIIIEAKGVSMGNNSGCFTDVAKGSWYEKYACHAKSQGWVSGYSDGTFKPAKSVTFVEALKMLMEVYGVDYPNTAIWYEGIVDTAANDNIIPLTIKSFSQNLDRGEMADMITRKMKDDDGKLAEYLGEKASYKVDYDSIKAGKDLSYVEEKYRDDGNEEESDNSENGYEGVTMTISKVGVTANSITVKIGGVTLRSGDKYYVECIRTGSSGTENMFPPDAESVLSTLKVTGLESNTEYSCRGYVKDSNGNANIGDVAGLYTSSLKITTSSGGSSSGAYSGVTMTLSKVDVTSDYVTVKVNGVTLQSGDRFYVECLDNYSDNMVTPDAYSTSKTITIDGLESGMDYSCIGYIKLADSNATQWGATTPMLKITTDEVAEPELVTYDAGSYSFEYMSDWDFNVLFPNTDDPIYQLAADPENASFERVLDIRTSYTFGVEDVMDLYRSSSTMGLRNEQAITVDGHSGYKYDLRDGSGFTIHYYTIGIGENSNVTAWTYTNSFLDEYEDVVYSIEF